MSKQAMTMALDALQSCTYDDEGYCLIPDNEDAITALRAALDAPEPTVPDNMQDWKGMDGAIAWHLIERHADNWADIGKMMGEWLAANQTVLDAPERDIGRTLDQFLCNGTRIKLNFNRIGNMTSLQNMAHDLQGRWVALVPAENDCHLKRTEYVPMSDERIISLAYDCNAMPEFCTDESLKLFVRAVEQEVRGK